MDVTRGIQCQPKPARAILHKLRAGTQTHKELDPGGRATALHPQPPVSLALRAPLRPTCPHLCLQLGPRAISVLS